MARRYDAPAVRRLGPLVLSIDVSGSMDYNVGEGATRLTSAFAVGMALAWVCRRQGRPFGVYVWSDSRDALVDLKDGNLRHWSPGRPWVDFPKFYRDMRRGGGGTESDLPFRVFPEQVWPRLPGALRKKADHVVITDCVLSVEGRIARWYKNWAAAGGVRTFLVAVGVDDERVAMLRQHRIDHPTYPHRTAFEMADRAWCVSDPAGVGAPLFSELTSV